MAVLNLFRLPLLRLGLHQKRKMTISAAPCVKDGCLMVRGRVLLNNVPSNVVVSPAAGGSAFLGANAAEANCRHVFPLGVLEPYRFLCLYRLKIWWMIPKFGKLASEIPCETQLLLLEVRESSAITEDVTDSHNCQRFYILLLSVLDEQFRTSLEGNSANELSFCTESGDPNVQCTQRLEAVLINSGDNPFDLLKDSVKILEKHKGTFCHVENKTIPAYLDWFGWCTWDAFYTDVNPQGIREGLKSLSEGGAPAKFLIIDDGWQDTFNEFRKDGVPVIEGTQFASQLVDIKENDKFKNIVLGDNSVGDIKSFIKSIKTDYGLKFIHMWHALAGYWGGVLPTSECMKKYNPQLKYPNQSPGNIGNLRDIAMDSLEKYGVGIIDPAKIYDFYNDLHGYLSSKGVDGVKVDVQNLIETLGSGYGGRVSLTGKYQKALEDSVAKNFPDNNLICCMSHNSDYFYSSKKSAVVRASEDFMPREPSFQTLHVASVAFNSLLLGEIVVPDWDMFHSDHATAEFHGAARAIGGCGVYVSDKPGKHDFQILKKLVLPDGSVLRARYAGRPTRDCLFDDPVMDGKSLLKLWNMNKFSGVVGIFNCQGAGFWPLNEESSLEKSPVSNSLLLSGHVFPLDAELLQEIATENWTGECAVYACNAGSLSKVSKEGSVEVFLSTLQCEIYTITPIEHYGKVQFAPLGLIDMFNSGGAISQLDCVIDLKELKIKMEARGSGCFGAYSNVKPNYCLIDAKEEHFTYFGDSGLLTFELPASLDNHGLLREISVIYWDF